MRWWLPVSRCRPPVTGEEVRNKTAEFRSAVNAPVAHTNAIIAPARAIHSRDFPVSFLETSAPRERKRERETCRTAGSRVGECARGWMVHTVAYIRGGGEREVTRQGFNGILFTGFVPRLGKHSASADPSGRGPSSSASSPKAPVFQKRISLRLLVREEERSPGHC